MVEEIKKAILNNAEFFNGVKLPTRQTAGSDHQITTYASIQANNFYIENFHLINK
jgi:hypothetical protein|tara:strand:- start:445 stop:609 length:165 start_codon:yes stop_codon:yes gene_type:complete